MDISQYLRQNKISEYIIINDCVTINTVNTEYSKINYTSTHQNYWIIFIKKSDNVYVALSTSPENFMFNKLELNDLESIYNYLKNDHKNFDSFNKTYLDYFIKVKSLTGQISYSKCKRKYYNSKGNKKQYVIKDINGYFSKKDDNITIYFDKFSIDLLVYLTKKKKNIIKDQLNIDDFNDGFNIILNYNSKLLMKINTILAPTNTKKFQYEIPIIDFEKELIDQLKTYYMDINNYENNLSSQYADYIYIQKIINIYFFQLYAINNNTIYIYELFLNTSYTYYLSVKNNLIKITIRR